MDKSQTDSSSEIHNESHTTKEKLADFDPEALKEPELLPTSTNYAQFDEVNAVKQGLHQRHIQMIALAGTIGTGLFLGSGRALTTSGPLGIFLEYSITGLIAVTVVFAVAEMGVPLALTGGYIRYSEYFVDFALSFAQGRNMIYAAFVAIPVEIVATAVLIQFWIIINNAMWITVFGSLILFCSLAFVRLYSELKFGFAILKILLIIEINIMALVITCGGGPDHEAIEFRFWRNPGPLSNISVYPMHGVDSWGSGRRSTMQYTHMLALRPLRPQLQRSSTPDVPFHRPPKESSSPYFLFTA